MPSPLGSVSSSTASHRWNASTTSTIQDTAGPKTRRAVRHAIRAAGAKLFFLPAYSPDLNPIEQAFAKMKTLLRKADARAIEQTWRTIGALLDCFTPTECANYFRNAGYASA